MLTSTYRPNLSRSVGKSPEMMRTRDHQFRRLFSKRCVVRDECAGFTLIEALIALLVLTTGLAGLAGLILVGIKSQDSAVLRSNATTLAFSIADSMRANRDNAGAYTGSFCNAGKRHPADARACGAAPGGSAMAAVDLQQWWQSLDSSGLPNWYAEVWRQAGTNRYRVAVQWDDTRAQPDAIVQSGATKAACSGGGADTIPDEMEQVCITTDL